MDGGTNKIGFTFNDFMKNQPFFLVYTEYRNIDIFFFFVH